MPRTLAGDRASTGHVWITIWRRYGRDPFRIFSPPSLLTASVLVTGGGCRQGLRARPLAPHRDPAYLHSSSTSLVHSPYTRDLAGAGVIGARSHAGPGCRKVPRARLRSAVRAWIVCPSVDRPRSRGGSGLRRPEELTRSLQVMTGWPWPTRSRPRPAAGDVLRGRLASFESSLRALAAPAQ